MLLVVSDNGLNDIVICRDLFPPGHVDELFFVLVESHSRCHKLQIVFILITPRGSTLFMARSSVRNSSFLWPIYFNVGFGNCLVYFDFLFLITLLGYQFQSLINLIGRSLSLICLITLWLSLVRIYRIILLFREVNWVGYQRVRVLLLSKNWPFLLGLSVENSLSFFKRQGSCVLFAY